MKPSFYWNITKRSFNRFFAEDIFTWAAALAYYTIFSLPPILLIVLFSASMVYDQASVQQVIFGEIAQLIGQEGALQLSNTVNKLYQIEGEWWTVGISIGILLFTSTTVFVTIQMALNKIFEVQAKPSLGWLKLVRDRLLSFALVLGLAFILLLSLTVNAMVTAFSNYLAAQLPDLSVLLLAFASIVLPLLVTAFLFAVIFRFLPDVRLRWRDVSVGAIVTALLFAIGKNAIGFYIGNSNLTGLYDAAGSVLVIMVWVFYASIIFLFGAVFTFVYTKAINDPMPPQSYAVKVEHKNC